MLMPRMAFKGKHPSLFTEDDILSHMDWVVMQGACKEHARELALMILIGTFQLEMFCGSVCL